MIHIVRLALFFFVGSIAGGAYYFFFHDTNIALLSGALAGAGAAFYFDISLWGRRLK